MKPKTASPPEDHRISAIALQLNLFWLSPKFTFFLHLRDCNGLPWTWPLSNNENVLPISFTHKICWIYSCLIYPRFKRQHGACGKRNYTWPSWGQIGVKLNQRHAINDMIKSQWKVMGEGKLVEGHPTATKKRDPTQRTMQMSYRNRCEQKQQGKCQSRQKVICCPSGELSTLAQGGVRGLVMLDISIWIMGTHVCLKNSPAYQKACEKKKKTRMANSLKFMHTRSKGHYEKTEQGF